MSKTNNISRLISEEKENINNDNNTDKKIAHIISKSEISKKYKIDELNYLKEDIMQYFKEKLEDYSSNLYQYISKINKIEKNFEEMANNINLNYNEIIKTQAKMNSELDKLKNYESFSNNVNDKLISHEIRLNNYREEFIKATQKYDKIYLDNLELPGYIGRNAKYKNCQIFFNEIIKNLGTLNQFREKNILDLKSYKEKLESIIKSFNILVDNNNQAQIKYINSLNQNNINDCQNMIKILEERILDLKVENTKYSLDIIKKKEEMDKKWSKFENMKEEIVSEFDIRTNEYKKMNEDTGNKFDEFKKEYKIIRDKFFELADFIKDIRFQKNIKNIYSQILYRKNIKSICKSLNELDNIKNDNKTEAKDLELIKNISSIEKLNFKINKNNILDQNTNMNISQEISNDEINDYNQNKNNGMKKSVEYNSPYKFNKLSRNEKIALIKNNRTIDYNQKSNNYKKDIKNLTVFGNSNINNIENEKDKEEYKNNMLNNYIKKKNNQKIVIESKGDTSAKIKNKSLKQHNIEDSNSLVLENQSTIANYNNSNTNTNITNDFNNNISFSSVSTFCLNNNNNNNNKNFLINDICLDTNDKVIKELASELEQSTAKKDKIYINKKNEIEPKNLMKSIKEEKENIEAIGTQEKNDKTDIGINIKDNNEIFIEQYNKTDFINDIHYSKKLNNEIEKEKKPYSNHTKKKNEFILYGNDPRAIDKKFFMTDKKLLDLEEFTKDKFMEIINQIEKMKNTNNDNNNQQKINKSNILSFSLYKDKANSLSNVKNDSNNNTSFVNSISNKLKFFNPKINENKSARKNFENCKKEFDLTSHNFRKKKFYNLEQINQKIFNSSCKKIKAYTNDEKGKDIICKNYKDKEHIKNKIVSRNDISCLEQKKSDIDFYSEKKKWETLDNINIKNSENKKQKNRNISSGNLHVSQKNKESVSFNEADIKLVYLNKFVNNKLPFAPCDSFLGEKI